jgi:hypothetical protein
MPSLVPHGAWHHLSDGMSLAALRHTEMAREFATLWAVVSYAAELVLGNLPDELATDFQKMEDQCSWLERQATRICNLLLGPPPDQA